MEKVKDKAQRRDAGFISESAVPATESNRAAQGRTEITVDGRNAYNHGLSDAQYQLLLSFEFVADGRPETADGV